MDTTNTRITLGDRLRSRREAHGLSQETLAGKLHVTRQTVSGWERGRSEPDIASLQSIAEIYGVTIDVLLDNVAAEPTGEPMKQAALFIMAAGFALCGLVVWGGITGRCGFAAVAFCATGCVFINPFLWFTLSGASESGDVDMLSGYDARLRYHMPTLRRVLDAQRFWLLLCTFMSCIPFFFSVFWPVQAGLGFIFGVCISYISGIMIGLGYIQRKYNDSLYIDAQKAWPAQGSSVPLCLYLGSLFATLISAAVGIEAFGLTGLLPAVLFIVFFLIVLLLQFICFLTDMKHNRRLAEQGEKYRLRKRIVAWYAICLVLNALLLLVCALSS